MLSVIEIQSSCLSRWKHAASLVMLRDRVSMGIFRVSDFLFVWVKGENYQQRHRHSQPEACILLGVSFFLRMGTRIVDSCITRTHNSSLPEGFFFLGSSLGVSVDAPSSAKATAGKPKKSLRNQLYSDIPGDRPRASQRGMQTYPVLIQRGRFFLTQMPSVALCSNQKCSISLRAMCHERIKQS
jgi:hypothetical protein